MFHEENRKITPRASKKFWSSVSGMSEKLWHHPESWPSWDSLHSYDRGGTAHMGVCGFGPFRSIRRLRSPHKMPWPKWSKRTRGQQETASKKGQDVITLPLPTMECFRRGHPVALLRKSCDLSQGNLTHQVSLLWPKIRSICGLSPWWLLAEILYLKSSPYWRKQAGWVPKAAAAPNHRRARCCSWWHPGRARRSAAAGSRRTAW